MSKRNIFQQLKNASKIVEKNLKETIDESAKKINEFDTNAALNKIKQQINKSGQKIKEVVDKTKNETIKIKDKIITNTNSKPASLSKQKNTTKQESKKVDSRESQYSQIIKSKLSEGQKYVQSNTEQFAKKVSEMKIKLYQQQKTPKTTFQNISARVNPWLKKNDNFYENLLISKPKRIMRGVVSNIYWRIIFGACLVVMVYGLSTTAFAQLRKYHVQVKKLEMQNNSQSKSSQLV